MAGIIKTPLADQALRSTVPNPAYDNQDSRAAAHQKKEFDPSIVMNLLDAQFERLLQQRINILRTFHAKVESTDHKNFDTVCSEIQEFERQLLQVSAYFEQSRHCKYRAN